MKPACSDCGSSRLYQKEGIEAGASESPNLLPGLGTFFSYASMTAVLCADCGLVRFYASQEARHKAMEKWARIR
jgi:predicted nucleic-acid-binding Zn-ribbon protein